MPEPVEFSSFYQLLQSVKKGSENENLEMVPNPKLTPSETAGLFGPRS